MDVGWNLLAQAWRTILYAQKHGYLATVFQASGRIFSLLPLITPTALRATLNTLRNRGIAAQASNGLGRLLDIRCWGAGPIDSGEHAGFARRGDHLAIACAICDFVNSVASLAEPATPERIPDDASNHAAALLDVVCNASTVQPIFQQAKGKPNSQRPKKPKQEHGRTHRFSEDFISCDCE